ncbi:hypothetical protein ES703_45543 [subsurface metagenome]
MGNGKGLGGLIALLGLVLIMGRPKELKASDFYMGGPTPPPGFFPITIFGPSITYEAYRTWALDPEAPEEELVPHATDPEGYWRTVNGRIPTPAGGTIPIPVPFPGGIIDVNKMLKLKPIEESIEPEDYPDVGEVISINLRLKEVAG